MYPCMDRSVGVLKKMTRGKNESDKATNSHWLVKRDMDKCSLCEVCTRCCPTGALQPKEEGDTLSILFRPDLCDGCGKCLENCPEDASRLVKVSPADSGQVTILV